MVQITWLGHSTFELKLTTGEVYLLDPWLKNPKAPEAYQPSQLDGILVSHGHGDHIGSVVPLAEKFGCPVVCIDDLAEWFSGQKVTNTLGLNKGGTVKVGVLSVTLTFASHSSPHGDPCGMILGLPDGRNIYYAGDTDVFGDMRLIAEIYNPEIAILPIGDVYTMGPLQAFHAVKMLRPKYVIPMHYGTFPALTGSPETLAKMLEGLPETKLRTLQPGETIEL